MSQDGHRAAGAIPPDRAAVVAVFPMAKGALFEWHVHDDHQLAWASQGVLAVRTEQASWMLPPTRALWLPAGLSHEARASSPATMRSVYVAPDRCPVRWGHPTPIGATPLLAELIGHLENESLDRAARAHAEAVLFDLLRPVHSATIEVRMPSDDRALEVAQALLADPADRRDLGDWGRAVGASERTLARGFAGTGLSYGRWRTLVRLQAALPLLAAEEPISRIAPKVGYETTSAFVAAFRRETGRTPATYFAVEQGY